MPEYAWRPGRSFKADPNEAQELFAKLKKTVGLTTHNVLDAARPKSSVLHGDFEWNNGAAAELYRLQQARMLVRAVVLVQLEEEPEDHSNVWIHTKTAEGEGIYEYPRVVVRDPTLLSTAIQEARQYLASGEKRWGMLREVSRGFKAARKAFDETLEN
jgi:hypothetical protein